MMHFPSEWQHHFGANIATAIPERLGARFRYFDRIVPLPSFAEIVDRMLATDPEFRVREIGDMVRIITVEGEYGAWVAIEGRREGGRAMRYIGAAFLDDFATALDVLAIIPQHFSEVEQLSNQLVRSQTFEMQRRPRRYFYVPPPGWQAIPSGLAANWYPLDFPKNLTNLVVPPASYFDSDAETAIAAVLDAAGAGLSVEDTARDTIRSVSGIEGTYLRLAGRRDGRRLFRDVVIYAVPPHAYHLRLETANEQRLLEHRELFLGVARSFRPLPLPDEIRVGQAFATMPTETFSHWVS